jgi:hypothetical protein
MSETNKDAKIDRLERQLKEVWGRIPSKELAMLVMTSLMGISSTDVGKLYDINQGAVSYRLKRAKERIRIYCQQAMVDEEELIRDFGSIFKDEITSKTLEIMWFTSNQSEAAKELKISQFKARHRWLLGFNSISYLLSRLLLEETYHRGKPYSGQKMVRVFTDIDPDNIPLPADDSQEELSKYEKRKAWVAKTMTQIRSNLKVDPDYHVFSPDKKKRFQLYYDVFRQIRENYHILTDKLHKWRKRNND